MKMRLLIIGAGISGEIIGREINHREQGDLIGYLDDDIKKHETTLNNKPIFGGTNLIRAVIDDKKIDRVIISIPSAEGKTIKSILKSLIQTDVQIQMVPGYYHILDEDIKIDYPIRDIDISDLLGRPQVQLNTNNIASYLTNKSVLITGAGGSIGKELSKLIASVNPREIILLGRGENSIFEVEKELEYLYPDVKIIPVIANIYHYSALTDLFTKHHPQVIFHAAAHKHVYYMENHVKEAFRNNVIGTYNIMSLAHQYNVERVVFISTDKAVQPKSVMGLSKRLSELITSYYSNQSKTVFCAVRFGNVLGSRGSVLQLFKDQIKRGGPVTITDKDVVRYFMTIPEASQLVIQAGGLATGNEIFILNMGEPIRIYDLAKMLIQLYHPHTDKEIDIHFIGLREGEKLTEKLWTSSEKVKSSEHNDIFVVHPKPVDFKFLSKIKQIDSKIDYMSERKLKEILFTLLDPTFLESMDKKLVRA